MLRPIIALSAASGIGLYRRNFSHCSADAQKWPFEAKVVFINTFTATRVLTNQNVHIGHAT